MIEMTLDDVVASTATPTPTKSAAPSQAPASTEAKSQELVTADSVATARRSTAFLKPPVINLAQKVGELGDNFAAGSIVFDKMISLGSGAKAGDDAIQMILLSIRTHFVQHRAYGAEGLPESYPTEEAVLAAGGVLRKEDDETGSNWFRPAADIVVLVRAPASLPEEALGLFPFEVDGKHWGPAIWYVRATAVTPLIGRGFGRAALVLGKSPWLGVWNVTTSKQAYNGNSWFAPAAQFVSKIDADSELGKLAAEKAAELAG